MDESAVSVNGVSIRLPNERWEHVIERHDDLVDQKQFVLDTISSPNRVLLGNDNALMALREITSGKWLVVVYREEQDDGFIITAFTTRRINSFNRRTQIWQP
jgi:hypothetical protein